ncbi:hypothetical protein LBWT_X4710 (plasmid) [Leptolyngbya boryana IAM M-101]|nr:hypothetical protein LBWT_X4710 [Leptolyngbya boryana IAM M-101]BAS66747.1 hypothetical protein LBDG_X4710 [Leptolyngbya boryana dg5]
MQWFRRVRECQTCKHKFPTAETSESLLDEMARLREQLAEENRQKTQELLDLHEQLAEHNRKVMRRIRARGNWVVREETIALELAQEFVRRSAWWLNHPSGQDVRAPRYAERIYKSAHGWTLEFGANKFLVGKAIERCQKVVIAFLESTESVKPQSLADLKKALSLQISGSVANCNDEEYQGCYPVYSGQLVFGNAAIDIADAVDFLFEEAEIDALFIR